MSIRIKLLLSYTGMLIVSLLVVALTAGLYGYSRRRLGWAIQSGA